MENKEIKDAEDLVSKGLEFYEAKKYEEAIECYEKAIRLNPNNALAFRHWGNALSDQAEINKDENLFNKSFEKYEKATQLNPNYADTFNSWGSAISDLAKIKQDENLFNISFENFEKAIRLNPNYADAFNNWGIAISDLAKIKQDETLFNKSFEKYEVAGRLYKKDSDKADTFHGWGYALYELAMIKQDETLFREACEKYDKATQLNQEYVNTFNNWGLALCELAKIKQDEALFKEACEKYDKTIQLDPNNAAALYNWGIAVLSLAEIKKDEDFQKNLRIFEKASKEIDDIDVVLIKGEIYLVLGRTEEAKECFKNSKKSILEILTFLYDTNRKKIMNETKILHSLLTSNNNDTFFKETTKNLTLKQLDKYKEIYIRSIFITSLLHIKDENEKLVAHYREKEVSQKLLFDSKFKFRLNAIDYSNDLSEGKTLLDFLYEKEKRPSDEKSNNEEYEAFASCFGFDYDNLNMFRLYGKEQGKEGTGLSLVFKDSFFSKAAKMVLGSPKTDSFKTNNDNSTEKDKLTLFRCIYIDPNPKTDQHVVTVGRKEKYLFHREEKGGNFKNYNEKIEDIIKQISDEMDVLKKLANGDGIDYAIVGQLILNLRYLVKHVAFKEEQECRIVKILNLSNDECIKIDDYKQMYIEYSPKVSEHIDKIHFGPKAVGFELFKSMLKKQFKDRNIPCSKSENPLT